MNHKNKMEGRRAARNLFTRRGFINAFYTRAGIGFFIVFKPGPRGAFICARSEAPIGCLRDSGPPLGFIGSEPSIFVAPLTAKIPPSILRSKADCLWTLLTTVSSWDKSRNFWLL